MTFSNEGVKLTKAFEGFRGHAYRDSAGYLTRGWGHRPLHPAPEFGVNSAVSVEQAEQDLSDDLAKAANCVSSAVVVPLTQNQFDALTDFVFNLGCGTLRTSHLLGYLNKREYKTAADQFPRFVKAGGKVEQGLVRRRAAERLLFLKGM